MPPPISGAKQPGWFKHLDHARLTGVKPTWRAAGFYTVPSPRTGVLYEVRRVPLGRHLTYGCDCLAGRSRRLCWHVALVAALPYEIRLRKGFELSHDPCTACGCIKSATPSCTLCDNTALD